MGSKFNNFIGYVKNDNRNDMIIPFNAYSLNDIIKPFILFISIQYIRQPVFRANLTETFNALVDLYINYAKQYEFYNSNLDEAKLYINDKEIEKAYHISMVGNSHIYDSIIQCIAKMSCEIIINKTSVPFITSDAPVCPMKKINDKYISSLFKQEECNMVKFPVTKEICLLFYSSPCIVSNNWYIKWNTDAKQITQINTIISKFAQYQIYTCSEELTWSNNVDFQKIKFILK